MTHTSLEKKALDDVSFTLEKGEFVALIGHTGSGKSTLAEHLNGLLHPMAGKVLVDGVDLAAKTPEAKTARNRWVWCSSIRNTSCCGNHLRRHRFRAPEPGKVRTGGGRSGAQRHGIRGPGFRHLRPAVTLPAFRGADAPGGHCRGGGHGTGLPDHGRTSAGLDPISRDSIFGQLRKIFEKRKMGVLLITHSMEEAAQYASRLLVMSDSRLQLDGPARELFTHERENWNPFRGRAGKRETGGRTPEPGPAPTLKGRPSPKKN